jgi:hypothetical protein
MRVGQRLRSPRLQLRAADGDIRIGVHERAVSASRKRGQRGAERVARAAGTGGEKVRWWLGSGTEQCGFCLAWFHHVEQYRCDACDAAICPFCAHVIRDTYAVRCPDCGKNDDQEE